MRKKRVGKLDLGNRLVKVPLDLPIMKHMGQNVQVEVTPLRRYKDFAADVKERLN